MEHFFKNDIFHEKQLLKFSPDYNPTDIVHRMQLRRSIVKDRHSHGVLKNRYWQRILSNKTSAESIKLQREIKKIRDDFQKTNLKNNLSLKNNIRNNAVNKNYITFLCNELDLDLSLNNNIDSDDIENLVLYGENDFQIEPKKSVKLFKTSDKTESTENAYNEEVETGVVNAPSNKHLLHIDCTLKHFVDETYADDIEIISNHDEITTYPASVTCNTIQESELQNLLTMMAITSKSDEKNVFSPREDTNDFNEDNKLFSSEVNMCKTNPNNLEIDNLLNITSLTKMQIERVEFLSKKYLRKWRLFMDKRKAYLAEQRQATLDSFFEKLEKKKNDANQEVRPNNKIKQLARDYSTYHHRYKVQKHIIALQKVKLEQQNRVIEELKYNKIVDASKHSVDAMKDEIRKTYFEIDRHLKPKIKCLTNELKIPEIEEPALILHCLKVPQFLQRMEARAREREEKHAMIRERRRQMEEERIRLKQQAELAKAEMDKEEKARRIKELREKRKREKIENIRKKQHAERLRGLIVMADLHYEKVLMTKYAFQPLRRLVEIRRVNIEKAKYHYRFQLKKNMFLRWMWHTEDMWIERNYKAEDFYRKKVMKMTLEAFKQNHHEYILKKQVAEDYYDLYLTQLVYRKFREGINEVKRESEILMQKAVIYHNSNVLFKTFTCWRTLPALNCLKREQDARKARWREKVLQVVPDYIPPDD